MIIRQLISEARLGDEEVDRIIRKIIELHYKGLAISQIADLYGLSVESIQKVIEDQKDKEPSRSSTKQQGSVSTANQDERPVRKSGLLSTVRNSNAQLVGKEQEIADWYNNGYTIRQLAEKYRVNHKTVESALKRARKNGIEIQVRKRGRQPKFTGKEQEIANLYNSGLTASQIAEKYETTYDTIKTILLNAKKKGIEISAKRKIDPKILDRISKLVGKEQEIANLYNNGYTIRQLAEKYGVSKDVIRSALKRAMKNGIQTQIRKRGQQPGEIVSKFTGKEQEIVDLYNSGLTTSQLAEKYETTRRIINIILLNAKKKSKSEIDPEVLDRIIKMYNDGVKINDIAKAVERHESKVRRTLTKARKSGLLSSARNSRVINNDEYADIANLYNNGHTMRQLAKKYDVSIDVIRSALKRAIKNGIETQIRKPGKQPGGAVSKLARKEQEIVDLYNSGLTASQIAEKYETTHDTIKTILLRAKRKGIEISAKKRGRKIDPKILDRISKLVGKEQEISDLYNNGYTIRQLAEKYGVNTSAIRRVLKRADQSNVVIDDIIRMLKSGFPATEVAKAYKISVDEIRNILDAVKQGRQPEIQFGNRTELPEITSSEARRQESVSTTNQDERPETLLGNNQEINALKRRGPKLKITNDQEVVDLYNSGYTIRQLSKKYGTSVPTIYNTLRRAKERGVKILNSEEKLSKFREDILKLYNDGSKPSEIARKYGVSKQAINQILGVTRPSVLRKERTNLIIKMYEDGVKITDIAKEFGKSRNAIIVILRKARKSGLLSTRRRSNSNLPTIKSDEYVNLANLYNSGYSIKQLAEKYDASTIAIRSALKRAIKNGIEIKIRKHGRRSGETRSKLIGKEQEIADLYNSGLTASQIAEKYETTYNTIVAILSKAKGIGIEISAKKPGRKIDPKVLNRIIKMYNDGAKIVDIAKAVERHEGRVRKILAKARKSGLLSTARNIQIINDDEYTNLANLYNSGYSTYSLAKKYGVSKDAIQSALKRAMKNGITVQMRKRGKQPREEFLKLVGKEQEIADLYNSGLTASQLAEKYETTHDVINVILLRAKRKGIEISAKKPGRKIDHKVLDRIIKMYNDGAKINDIAKAVERHEDRVTRILAKARKSGLLSTATARNIQIINDDEYTNLANLYNSGYTIKRLAEKYDVSTDAIRSALKRAIKNGITVQMRKRGQQPREAVSKLAGKEQEIADSYNSGLTALQKKSGRPGRPAKAFDFRDVQERYEYTNLANLYNSGYTIKRLAEKYDVSTDTIRSALKRAIKNGIEVQVGKRGRPSGEAFLKLVGKEQEIANLYNSGYIIKRLAGKYDVSTDAIRSALRRAIKNGIEIQVRKRGRPSGEAFLKLVGKEQEIADLYNSGLTALQIAEKYQTTHDAITAILSKARRIGIAISAKKPGRKIDPKILDRIIKMYNDGAKINDIAKEFGESRRRIERMLTKARKSGLLSTTRNSNYEYANLVNLYNSGYTIKRLAGKYDVSTDAIRSALRRAIKNGITVQMRKRGKGKLSKFREDILKLYNDGSKPSEIARKYGVSKQAINQLLERAGATRASVLQKERTNQITNRIIKMYEDGVKIVDIAKEFGKSKRRIEEILRKARKSGLLSTARSPNNLQIINDDEYANLANLYNSGYTIKRLAEKYDVSTDIIRSALKRAIKNGIEVQVRKRGRQPNTEMLDRIIKMYEDGVKINDIAKEFGKSRRRVERILAKARKSGLLSTARNIQIINDDEYANLANLYNSGYTIKRLAEKYDVSTDAIRSALKRAIKNGIEVQVRKRGQQPGEIISKFTGKLVGKEQEAVDLYNNGYTIRQLAEKYDVSAVTVQNALKRARKNGIEVVAKNNEDKPNIEILNRIVKMYEDGVKIADIAKEFGKSRRRIGKILAKARKSGLLSIARIGPAPQIKSEDINNILELYKNGLRTSEIARKYNVSIRSIRKLLRKLRDKGTE